MFKQMRWVAAALCALSACPVVHAQDPPSPELELVGHLPLGGQRVDIAAHKNVAYVGGNLGGTTGMAIIDIADPKNPTLLGNLPAKPGTSYESVKVISADTAAFKGDLLVVSLQRSAVGVEFWDVTDPRQPRLLGFFRTGSFPVSELHLLQRGDRILALLATGDGGLRIVDATDPARPALLTTWVLQKELKINPVHGVSRAVFEDSVSANADGTIAYLSYWDAGAVILDISDPAKPVYLGRTVYALTDEGDTHEAVEGDGGRLLVTTDEDVDPSPAANAIRVLTPASLAGLREGVELAVTRQLVGTGPTCGEVVYVGKATADVALLADPRGKIALIDVTSDQSQPRAQVQRAQEAGAIAVLVGRTPSRQGTPNTSITIPGVGIDPQTAEGLKTALAAGEKVEVELATTSGTWGFVRLWDIRDRTKPVQVGTFATAATRQFPPSQDGWFTARTPVVRGNRLYVSWHVDGVRVVDITDPARPKEIGHFVPPFQQGKLPIVVDVVEHNGLLLLSDVQTGLWIVRDLPQAP